MNLDLHLHSTASDGKLDPAAVVDAAIEGGLDVIALTDHDTVAGIAAARTASQGRNLDLITGIEVSSNWDGSEVHILGYFIDPDHPSMQGHGDRARERRATRLRAMVERLRDQGVDVSFDAVLEQAGPDAVSLGRPHLARELERRGFVESVPEAFERFIGNDHPAYVSTDLLTPEEAIELIHSAGGVALWAHPSRADFDDRLRALVRHGLDGIEVFRPWNSTAWTLRLREAARSHGLLVSGGSDWHGPDDGVLGEFRVSSEDIAGLLERGGF